MDYHVVWYILVGILLIGYAILDGFDLGVGALHLFAKNDHDRRILLNSIGPVWDGNEVWLITAGGALFAAFPDVYATAFSGFYTPLMLVLMALIFRAVAIEFRSKEESKKWRNSWDVAFSIGSMLAAFLFGLAIGNIIIGMEIGEDKEYAGTLLDQLNPYALLTGVFALVMFTLHGGIYLLLKTEGSLYRQIRSLTFRFFYVFILLYAIVTAATLYKNPVMIANFSFGYLDPISTHPLVTENKILISVVGFLIAILNFLAILNIHRSLVKGKDRFAFISSALSIAALVSLFAMGIFPNMIVSSMNPNYSLDIYNASSSEKTLKTMFWLAMVGIPFVLTYTISIYWIFRGKTELDEHSY